MPRQSPKHGIASDFVIYLSRDFARFRKVGVKVSSFAPRIAALESVLYLIIDRIKDVPKPHNAAARKEAVQVRGRASSVGLGGLPSYESCREVVKTPSVVIKIFAFLYVRERPCPLFPFTYLQLMYVVCTDKAHWNVRKKARHPANINTVVVPA